MLSLEKLIEGLDVAVEPFSLCEVRGDGRLDMGSHDHACIHYAMAGSGSLRVGDDSPITLAPGALIVSPAQLPHRLESTSDRVNGNKPEKLPYCDPLGDGWRQVKSGVGDNGVLVACGAVHAVYHQVHGLFDYLPEPLVEYLQPDDPMRHAFDLLLSELAEPKPGTRSLAQALFQQCLVLLLRRQTHDGVCAAPWLTALEDPRLGRAIAAMLDRPEAPHSLERLAETAGMSRSTFAEHFVSAFRRPPMDLLKEVRLRRAAKLLRSTDRPVEALAASVGYASRSSFSRAFKEFHGLSPADYRQSGGGIL